MVGVITHVLCVHKICELKDVTKDFYKQQVLLQAGGVIITRSFLCTGTTPPGLHTALLEESMGEEGFSIDVEVDRTFVTPHYVKQVLGRRAMEWSFWWEGAQSPSQDAVGHKVCFRKSKFF